jgi:hypothetical protein
VAGNFEARARFLDESNNVKVGYHQAVSLLILRALRLDASARTRAAHIIRLYGPIWMAF